MFITNHITIRRIQTDDGNVYEPQNQNIRALSPGSAYLVDQLMEISKPKQVLQPHADITKWLSSLRKNRNN